MPYIYENPLPPMDCLVAAMAAMEYGSFSAAAAALDLTHASISRRVSTAERWAGYLLFERHARGVRPTLEGQRLLNRLHHAFVELENLAERKPRAPTHNLVRIHTTPSLARFWLLPRIKRLENQGARIALFTSLEVQDFTSLNADIAIRYGKGGWSDGKELTRMQSLHSPVVHRDVYRELHTSPDFSLNELPLLHNADTFQWRSYFKAIDTPHTRKIADRVLADYSATIDAAQAELGVALWHRTLHELPTGLIQLDQPSQALELKYVLLSAHRGLSPPARDVCQALTEEIDKGAV